MTNRRTQRGFGTAIIAIMAIMLAASPARAASSSFDYSFSINGGSARGTLTVSSSSPKKFTVRFSPIKDSKPDGLCIRLHLARFELGFNTGSKLIKSVCGNQTSIYGSTTVSFWLGVPKVGLRLCHYSSATRRYSNCSSWKKWDNPYFGL